jgi:hypothetical protein
MPRSISPVGSRLLSERSEEGRCCDQLEGKRGLLDRLGRCRKPLLLEDESSGGEALVSLGSSQGMSMQRKSF